MILKKEYIYSNKRLILFVSFPLCVFCACFHSVYFSNRHSIRTMFINPKRATNTPSHVYFVWNDFLCLFGNEPCFVGDSLVICCLLYWTNHHFWSVYVCFFYSLLFEVFFSFIGEQVIIMCISLFELEQLKWSFTIRDCVTIGSFHFEFFFFLFMISFVLIYTHSVLWSRWRSSCSIIGEHSLKCSAAAAETARFSYKTFCSVKPWLGNCVSIFFHI